MKTILIALCLLCSFETAYASKDVIWKIGEADNSSIEFALAPNGWANYIGADFGWEDRFYAVGSSNPSVDWPYVLPGPADSWTQQNSSGGNKLNILFNIASDVSMTSLFTLVIDIQNGSTIPPILNVQINGQNFSKQLSSGNGYIDRIGQNSDDGVECIWAIDIPPGTLKKGLNTISLQTITGSWITFDQIRLEGLCDLIELSLPSNTFIKNVSVADYEINQNGTKIQPLLLNVIQKNSPATIEVKINHQSIFSKRLSSVEPNEYNFEIPVSAVTTATQNLYEIYSDGILLQSETFQQSPQRTFTLADYIDTRIGTAHSRWMCAPGPWMPMSMVKFSPDNQNRGARSGYDPNIDNIGGFSHIHEFSMEGVSVMPSNGDLKTTAGDQGNTWEGYRARFDRASEQAGIGKYSVYFPDRKIHADITQTIRCSFGKYTYTTDSQNSRIIIDMITKGEYELYFKSVKFQRINSTTIVGSCRMLTPFLWSGNGYHTGGGVNPIYVNPRWDDSEQDYTVYFAIEFDKPMTKIEYYINNDQAIVNQDNYELNYILPNVGFSKALINAEFNTSTDPVVKMRTGISFVSIDNAKLNLKTEITDPFGWDFDKVVQANRDVWNNLFSRVVIQTADKNEKMRFYNCFYRSVACRTLFNDVNGNYTDSRERKQNGTPGVDMYGSDALWNTFWNLNQFWNLVVPEISSNYVKGALETARIDNGWSFRAGAGLEHLPIMVAEHQTQIFVSAYQMGIRDYSATDLLEHVYHQQVSEGESIGGGFEGNRDIKAYMQYHYIPCDRGRTGVTMDYAFDDWAVAQLGKSLGRTNGSTDMYQAFLVRSEFWINTIDPEMKVCRMRYTDGSWKTPFDPMNTGGDSMYPEANGAMMTWVVPQNLNGLIETIGSDLAYSRLYDGFVQGVKKRYNDDSAIPSIIVNHGNEYSMHMAFIFNWMKKPWMTQKWVRSVIEKHYGFGLANAYPGDEDEGQMSAWLCMAAMGLFQMDGGARSNPIYEIGSPVYDRVDIDLTSGNKYGNMRTGKTFTIIAKNNSKENMYVQSAKLNGVALTNFWFRASELLKGGSLELEMGNTPNENWGLGGGPTTSE